MIRDLAQLARRRRRWGPAQFSRVNVVGTAMTLAEAQRFCKNADAMAPL